MNNHDIFPRLLSSSFILVDTILCIREFTPVWRSFKISSLCRQDGLCSPKCMDWSLKCWPSSSQDDCWPFWHRTYTEFQCFPGNNRLFVNCRLYTRKGATNHCHHDPSWPRTLSGLMHGSSSPQSSSSQKHTLPIPAITRGLGFFPFARNFVSHLHCILSHTLPHL